MANYYWIIACWVFLTKNGNLLIRYDNEHYMINRGALMALLRSHKPSFNVTFWRLGGHEVEGGKLSLLEDRNVCVEFVGDSCFYVIRRKQLFSLLSGQSKTVPILKRIMKSKKTKEYIELFE